MGGSWPRGARCQSISVESGWPSCLPVLLPLPGVRLAPQEGLSLQAAQWQTELGNSTLVSPCSGDWGFYFLQSQADTPPPLWSQNL